LGEETKEWYDKVLERNPRDVDALYYKGVSLDKLGKHEEAIVWYDKALEINPKYVDALNKKRILLGKLGKNEEPLETDKSNPVKAEKLYIIQEESLVSLSEDYVRDFLQNTVVKIDDKIKIPHNGTIIEMKMVSTYPGGSSVVVPSTEIHITTRQEIEYLSNLRPEEKKISADNACATPDCKTKLHDLNSKHCKLCNQRVCIDHLQLHLNKYCPKTMYVKYIRKLWLMKRGQNVSSGMYSIICETCGYVSDFPQLIEYAGQELELHLDNSPECKANKKTFLEELDFEPIPKGVHVESSIVHDPTRTLWVCAHCRPPRKFTNHDEYIAHHYTHS